MADGFQKKLEVTFEEECGEYDYNESTLCELLVVALDALTEREPENPVRDEIFKLVASNLVNLQKHKPFQQLLTDYPELGRCVSLRAGNG